MRLIGLIAVIFLGLAALGASYGPGNTPVQTSTIGAIDTSCSMAPVVMPQAATFSSLKQCQAAARAYMAAMISNVRVTATCRDEFIRRNGPNLPGAESIRQSSRELTKLIPELQRGAEKQLKQQATLGQCKQHLDAAHQLVIMQPELKGEWLSAALRR